MCCSSCRSYSNAAAVPTVLGAAWRRVAKCSEAPNEVPEGFSLLCENLHSVRWRNDAWKMSMKVDESRRKEEV